MFKIGVPVLLTNSPCFINKYSLWNNFLHFHARVTESMGIPNLTENGLKDGNQSAISEHLFQCNCAIIFDVSIYFAAESNKFKLRTRESLLKKIDKSS